MTMVLELPPPLEEELTQEAERIGVPADEHAQYLLWVASALLDRSNSTPVSATVRGFLAEHSVDHERVRRMLEQLVRRVQASTDDGVDLMITTGNSRVVVEPKGGGWAKGSSGESFPTHHPSAMGKYAHLNISSDDYARRKQEEIDFEDGGTA